MGCAGCRARHKRHYGQPKVGQKRRSGKLGDNGPKAVRRMAQLPKKADLPHEIGQRAEKSAFQIRSSQPQSCRFLRFWRLKKSISCVFSTSLNIPTPPASTISDKGNGVPSSLASAMIWRDGRRNTTTVKALQFDLGLRERYDCDT